MPNGENDFSLEELESLFKDEGQATPPASEGKTTQETPPTTSTEDDITKTKSFAKRLKEEKEKAKLEAQNEIATSLGYASYDELQKSKQNKLLEEKGLDPELVNPVVDEIVKKRLAEDPRMKELEELKQRQVTEFAKKELEDVNKLAGTNFASLEEVPKDVIEDWKKTGSLKKSYINLHGEELILKARSEASKGSTTHLNNPSGAAPDGKTKRHLTDEEKRLWKFFNPNMTDEELNNKYKEV